MIPLITKHLYIEKYPGEDGSQVSWHLHMYLHTYMQVCALEGDCGSTEAQSEHFYWYRLC